VRGAEGVGGQRGHEREQRPVEEPRQHEAGVGQRRPPGREEEGGEPQAAERGAQQGRPAHGVADPVGEEARHSPANTVEDPNEGHKVGGGGQPQTLCDLRHVVDDHEACPSPAEEHGVEHPETGRLQSLEDCEIVHVFVCCTAARLARELLR